MPRGLISFAPLIHPRLVAGAPERSPLYSGRCVAGPRCSSSPWSRRPAAGAVPALGLGTLDADRAGDRLSGDRARRAHDARSGRPGRCRQRGGDRAALRDAHDLRCADRSLQPALADSWQRRGGGTRVVFHLRPGLRFSDGSPLRASDVVRSWLGSSTRRIRRRSPRSCSRRRRRRPPARARPTRPPSGCIADDVTGEVTVELVRPASDFVDVVSSPSFAIVPPGVDGREPDSSPATGSSAAADTGDRADGDRPDARRQRALLGRDAGHRDDGARRPTSAGGARSRRSRPATSTTRRSARSTRRGSPTTRRSARSCGEVPSLSTEYYGFDTSRPPFDDVRVRQAFAQAVDWRRIARLGRRATRRRSPPRWCRRACPGGAPPTSCPSTIPPQPARSSRAQGIPGGAGFPAVTIAEPAAAYDEADRGRDQARARHRRHAPRRWASSDYFAPTRTDPPAMWFLWLDRRLPGPQRLPRGAARRAAHRTTTAGGSRRGSTRPSPTPAPQPIRGREPRRYDRAESIVQRDVPVIPVSYGAGWALWRDGLLGAAENGLGIIRMAGLAWAP